MAGELNIVEDLTYHVKETWDSETKRSKRGLTWGINGIKCSDAFDIQNIRSHVSSTCSTRLAIGIQTVPILQGKNCSTVDANVT